MHPHNPRVDWTTQDIKYQKQSFQPLLNWFNIKKQRNVLAKCCLFQKIVYYIIFYCFLILMISKFSTNVSVSLVVWNSFQVFSISFGLQLSYLPSYGLTTIWSWIILILNSFLQFILACMFKWFMLPSIFLSSKCLFFLQSIQKKIKDVDLKFILLKIIFDTNKILPRLRVF